MTEAELKKYRDTLTNLGRRLNGDTEELYGQALRPAGVAGEAASINGPGDTGDISVDTDTQDVSLSLLGNEQQMLAQVAAALKRLDEGTFGRCTNCGGEISRERLEAVPYTPYCVACAHKLQASGAPTNDPEIA